MATLVENINRAISDFDSIKGAIENNGVDVGNSPTNEYADKILAGSDLFRNVISGTETDVKIPNGTTQIRPYAFYTYTALKKIEIPGSVVSIGKFAFRECPNIEEIILKDGIQVIGEQAFYSCSKVTSLELPSSIRTIGNSAFRSCYGITEIIIPNGVQVISDYAFANCSGLTKVSLPNTLTWIEVDSFYYTGNITELNVEKGFNAPFLNLQDFTSLDADALVNVINALADRTNSDYGTLALGNINLSKLSDEQKALATEKNWILA